MVPLKGCIASGVAGARAPAVLVDLDSFLLMLLSPPVTFTRPFHQDAAVDCSC